MSHLPKLQLNKWCLIHCSRQTRSGRLPPPPHPTQQQSSAPWSPPTSTALQAWPGCDALGPQNGNLARGSQPRSQPLMGIQPSAAHPSLSHAPTCRCLCFVSALGEPYGEEVGGGIWPRSGRPQSFSPASPGERLGSSLREARWEMPTSVRGWRREGKGRGWGEKLHLGQHFPKTSPSLLLSPLLPPAPPPHPTPPGRGAAWREGEGRGPPLD